MKRILLALTALCILCLPAAEARPMHHSSVDTAMHRFLTAMMTKNSALFLSLVSHSRGLKYVNTINASSPMAAEVTTYSALARDFHHKGDLYQQYFTKGENDATFYDNIKAIKNHQWKRVAGNTFVPADDGVGDGKRHFYVQWRREGARWVIGEVGMPAS